MGSSLIVDRLAKLRLLPIRRQLSIDVPLLRASTCLLIAVFGCEKPQTANWAKNGFLDPTQVGQFRDPKRNPIRESLTLLEEPMHLERAEAPTADDLVPIYEESKIAGGDTITVSIFELLNPGQNTSHQIKVGEGGSITLPILGPLRVAGMTPREIELEIKSQLRAKQVLDDADVQVKLLESPGLTYSILGEVRRPGAYPIPTPEYRLLNALADAGGVPSELHELYVIRRGAAKELEPTSAPAPEPVHQHKHHSAASNQEAPHVVVAQPRKGPPQTVKGNRPGTLSLHEHGKAPTTQLGSGRVISIDVEELMNGVPSQNIVIQPLDLIYVSHGAMGEYYMAGNVARPGAYETHGHGPTLKQAIASAGGFGPLAWPSRVQIVRRLNKDEEQTIQVNLDAIFAGTEADVMLKPNDLVNVGTTALSPFLSVVRNAFRFSYGFGFVYDRNFADADSAQAREQVKSRRLQEARARGLPIR
ncbi:MAG: SLBB domain-containing protein [Planctomycetes bacterium]|nr:SLBB domain-containing protein [Planctomycetota bacterium]